MKSSEPFRFKKFEVHHDQCAMKVGTDAVLLGAWVDLTTDSRLLDIGTGSGVIALMLAQRSADTTHIDAVEINDRDYEQALDNFQRSPFAGKLTAIHSSIQHYFPPLRYDHIVSNPPYFAGSLLPPRADRSRARHDNHLSYTDLVSSAARLCSATGRFTVILPSVQIPFLTKLTEDYSFHLLRQLNVRTRPGNSLERTIATFGRSPGLLKLDELVIYNKEGAFSDEYRALTRQFYLAF